jgi:hypothetical protein
VAGRWDDVSGTSRRYDGFVRAPAPPTDAVAVAAQDIRRRVRQVAERTLAEQHVVRPVDVLLGLGWLAPSHVEQWRQGRVPHLERVTQASLGKISTAMIELGRWARERGLQPSETAYVARTRDRRPLRFSASGKPSIEQAYRTHWISPALSERKRERLAERQSRPPDLLVIAATKPWSCDGCGADSGPGGLLMMDDGGPRCLDCVDLGHLEFLPAGDAALTRRAKKASRLSAVVVRWSRSRKRYERQGILVEPDALERAEIECLDDAESRERRREREEERRLVADDRFVADLGAAVRSQFPGCPPDRADRIARHAGARASGRIGRTREGRELDAHAVRLAVIAAVRHGDTSYDELLMSGVSRAVAREQVRGDVDRVLAAWQAGR